jgi:hypothetical protein
LPGATAESPCLESPVLPVVATVSFSIERHSIDGTICIDIFPFTGQDTAITGLRTLQWKGGIHGNGLRNYRLGASCCKQREGKKKKDRDVSYEHIGISTGIAEPTYHFDEETDKRQVK